MDSSAKRRTEESVLRKLAFASRWALTEDESAEKTSTTTTEPSILFEPCVLGDDAMSLPVNLFALSLDDLSGAIFNMEVWNSLDSTSKSHLESLLPQGDGAPSPQTALSKLFSGENVKFGNPMTKFCRDLLAGEYNAEVQRFKQHAQQLEEQQRMLSVKMYHNKLVRNALEVKKKMGLKVDDGVLEFYKTQPDDADSEERRRLDRAHGAVSRRLKERKRNSQMSTLLAAATLLASKKDAEGENEESLRWTRVLADIGVQLPLELQIGLPYGEDDVYVSDDDGYSSGTASLPGSENEADVDELLEELGQSADGAPTTRGRNPKKRKRGDVEGVDGDDVGDGLGDAPTSAGTEKKKSSKLERRKALPPLPVEDSFSLFATIREFLNLQALSDPPATTGFNDIMGHIKTIPKLTRQVPHGTTLENMLVIALNLLLLDPSLIGYELLPKKQHLLGPSTALLHDTATNTTTERVPFMTRSGPAGGAINSPTTHFAWNLPMGHAQNDTLESLEVMYFFGLTRGHISEDGKMLSIEQCRVPKATMTLPAMSQELIDEFREQEKQRYNSPEAPFVYTCAHPPNGFSSRTISMPIPKLSVGHRKGMLLRQDRPEKVTNTSLVRDALSRLPGGVGTRSDIATLVMHSQFIAPELTDLSQVSPTVATTLDRMHLEYDSPVRYDPELRLYIFTHRQRTEEDFIRFTQLAERAKKGDTADLWEAWGDALERTSQPSSATLQSLLSSNASM